MSEEKRKEEGKTAKISKLAVISLVLMMPAAIASIISTTCSLYYQVPTFFAILYFTIILAGLIIAGISLLRIIKSNGKLKGKLFSGLSIAIFLFSLVWIPMASRGYGHTRVSICKTNLYELGIGLIIYSHDYQGKYPTADKWCDLLKDYHGENTLVCPAQKRTGERCSYAINPYCEPNSPNDVVLLFETKGGWNQFGGIEIVSTDNHPYEKDSFWGYKIRGCNIIFNDRSVRFVREEEFPKLKWKPDEVQEE